ncbi:putative type I restriction enzymeP M protein [Methylobacterium brachiatum]|nr:putative type I restriction enzymeP M protein [Methylobacterium brachiatum]
MARAARRTAEIGLTTIGVEGGLIAPAQIAAIAAAVPSAAEYGAPKGVTLRDEITRYFRIAQAHWRGYARLESPSAAQVAAFVRGLLSEAFGFDDLAAPASHERGGHRYPIALEARCGRVPIVVAAPLAGADAFHKALSEFGDGATGGQSRRSPMTLLQDWLNASDGALWGLVFAGDRLRLMRDNASFTRPAWIEADLGAILRDEMFADFTALWLLIHASRFGAADAPMSECALERWREAGAQAGTAARERLGANVVEVLSKLGQGLIDSNPDLRDRLVDGRLALPAFFDQLLRLVYRLIFLAVAEERGLLHVEPVSNAALLYRENYGFAYLRERSSRRASHDHHGDAWEGVKIIFTGLARGEPILALPALGGLFDPEVTPDLQKTRITNRTFLAAIFRLSWLIEKDGRRVRINWRDMATEELGSVYEGLLELVPILSNHGQTFAFAGTTEARGNTRKISGSYYTPDALVQALLDSALDPILERAEATGGADAILKLTVIDPACGSAHFLLGAARRIATRVATLRNPDAPDFQAAMRDVVRNCIHGVDRNPMAVELAKVALWIESVQPGKPLGFLDANIRCGDALLGVFDLAVLSDGIPDEAYKVLSGDDKETAAWFRKRNKAERDGQASFDWQGSGNSGLPPARLARDDRGFRALPEDAPDDIRAKGESFATHDAGWWADKISCDLYMAAFLIPKTGGVPDDSNAALIPTTSAVRTRLAGAQVYLPLENRVTNLAEATRTFHWPLIFPAVMEAGGFDIVLGNPPWETMSPDAKEFYSAYDPDVRFMAPSDQKTRIAELREAAGVKEEWDAYTRHLYTSANFFKESGRYTLFAEGHLGKGDFNIYRMFLELALRLVKPGGCATQFVPENFCNGANAATIRKHIFEKFKLKRLVGFENTGRVWFDIDTRAKFCMYVASREGRTTVFPAVFGINSLEKLASLGSQLPFEVPVSLVQEFSPEALAISEIAHASDLTIARKIYSRFPKFGETLAGIPTRNYSREIDMGNDREDFSDRSGGIPVYEGRMVEAFDHRAKAWVSGRGRAAVWRELTFGTSDKSIRPQWHLAESDVPNKLGERWLRSRLGFCDVASPTNQRSLVAAIVPAGVICGHKVPTVELVGAHKQNHLLLLACMNSFAIDYIVRKKISLSMTFTVVDSLPIPRSYAGTPVELEIVRRSLLLSATGSEMKHEWDEMAPLLDLDPTHHSPVEDLDRRRLLRAELDVLIARDLYNLTRDEMRYLLDPSDILGPEAGFETFGALKRADEREFGGRFLTRDLILEIWDELPTPNSAFSSSRIGDEARRVSAR